MQVIIPMSGVGRRFVEAGYSVVKPLIEINGKTIIEYVIEMFSLQDDFIFIVNKDHIETPNIVTVLKNKTPNAKIIFIDAHKLGPVFAVQQVYDYIDLNKPCIINYCDFNMDWNYSNFVETIMENHCDGAIVCYSGFHPHLLHAHNVYAGCKVNELNYLTEIKEKYSYTKDKTLSHHSTGTYYFKTGALMQYYIEDLIAKNHHLNGEYYASMLYEQMVLDEKEIYVYDKVEHFCQWGTPLDLKEYLWWEEVFLQPIKNIEISFPNKTTLLMPMAGEGSRFKDAGYETPKPFIEIDKEPMFLRVLKDLPIAQQHIFISKIEIQKELLPANSKFNIIKETTNGQASTCLLQKDAINNNDGLMISPCDNGMKYDKTKFLELTNVADVIVFTFKNNTAVLNNPNQYGWVVVNENNNALKISCKKQISNDPMNDHAITGAFWFAKGKYFVQAAEAMIAQQRTINNEYYVDECINDCIQMGLQVKVFEIDKYICWGTPNDLKTYLYWQSYFNKIS